MSALATLFNIVLELPAMTIRGEKKIHSMLWQFGKKIFFEKNKKRSLGLEYLLRNLIQATRHRTEHCVLCQTLSLCQVLGDVKESCAHVLKKEATDMTILGT